MEFYFTGFNHTILQCACMSGSVDLVKYIISLGNFEINPENIFFFFFFFLKFFFLFFFFFDLSNFFFWIFYTVVLIIIIYQNILHCACLSGSIDLVKYLLSFKKLDTNFINININLLKKFVITNFNNILQNAFLSINIALCMPIWKFDTCRISSFS